jgi:Fic-DOC domain mobile mystery protein B
MHDPLAPAGDGHTELDWDELQGLIPSYIATRGDLNEAEERNITRALLRRTPSTGELLDDAYLRYMHREMFGDVWAWAGKYRVRDTNIGVPFETISGSVRSLVLDGRAWAEAETFEPDELAIRFHHRLVAIHPFPNGNGRHGRVAADLLVVGLGAARFSWGAMLDVETDHLRAAYVGALQAADRGRIHDLMAFARS